MLYHAQPIKFRNFRLCVISNRATPVAGNNHRGILERVRVSDASAMMRCIVPLSSRDSGGSFS